MNINEIYNTIIDRLKEAGQTDKVKELEDLLSSASTASEALGLTGQYLITLKTNEISNNNSLKTLIENYINYCKENGVVIKAI
jgi:hypothetical protein